MDVARGWEPIKYEKKKCYWVSSKITFPVSSRATTTFAIFEWRQQRILVSCGCGSAYSSCAQHITFESNKRIWMYTTIDIDRHLSSNVCTGQRVRVRKRARENVKARMRLRAYAHRVSCTRNKIGFKDFVAIFNVSLCVHYSQCARAYCVH